MKKELMQSSNLTKPANAESGRSMVEMLGVLAIIGILSVGGVAGYGRAITNYRTNSAVETAQRQAAIVAGEVGLGQSVSPGSVTKLKAPAGYEVTVKSAAGSEQEITSTSPYFGVEIGGNSNGSSSTPLQSEVAKEMLERAIGEWKNVHAFGVKSSDGSSITWLNSTGSSDNGFEKAVGDAKTVIVIVVYASDLSLRPTNDLNVKGFDVTPDSNEEEPATDTCATCTASFEGSGVCSGTNCEGCVVMYPSEGDAFCVSETKCSHLCYGLCWDSATTEEFEGCCEGAGGVTKGCPQTTDTPGLDVTPDSNEEEPATDPCATCTASFEGSGVCSGTNCEGCVVMYPSEGDAFCVSETKCSHLCYGLCWDSATTEEFEGCCEGAGGVTKGCP